MTALVNPDGPASSAASHRQSGIDLDGRSHLRASVRHAEGNSELGVSSFGLIDRGVLDRSDFISTISTVCEARPYISTCRIACRYLPSRSASKATCW